MNTICKDCVFAEWEGNRQVQCAFDRLEKFQEQGTSIVEEQDDDGKSYFRIEGRVCNCCRHESTLTGIPARKWKEKVRQEVTVRVALAVYVDDCYMGKTIRTLDSFILQTVKPFEIILIYNVDKEEQELKDFYCGEEVPFYISYFTSLKDFAWRIETIKGVPTVSGDVEKADYNSSIDITVKSKEMKSIYFACCKAGYEFPERYIETIDDAINDKMDRFIALLPDEDGNGLFVQRGLHNLLNGNRQMHGCKNIIEKIEGIALDEGTSHMVKRFEDLVK